MVIFTETEFKEELEKVCEEVFGDKIFLDNPIVGLLCTMVVKELVTLDEAKLLARMNEEDRAKLDGNADIGDGESKIEEKPEV